MDFIKQIRIFIQANTFLKRYDELEARYLVLNNRRNNGDRSVELLRELIQLTKEAFVLNCELRAFRTRVTLEERLDELFNKKKA